jgi:putative Ca2+/H+ antiporter (TMEM165/GDT1 family)
MDWKLFALVFSTVFVAELGDKTQLATMLYAARAEASRLTVFVSATAALALSTALAVLAGTLVSQHVSERILSWIAGCGFIAVGIWTLARA